MNLYFRLLWVILSSFFKARIENVVAPNHLNLRVFPTDLDTNMHMNNGRYLTVMDLGRLDFILRTGVLRAAIKMKAIPVLSAAQIRYRIPLHFWERYTLETQMVCWDEKWVYMEQKFIVRDGKKAGQVAAIALLKGAFYSRINRETVPTAEILQAVGMDEQSPVFPDHVLQWHDAEKGLRDYVRQPQFPDKNSDD